MKRHYSSLLSVRCIYSAHSQQKGDGMSNWLTPALLSKKRGIPESTLRGWKCMGYIVSSTIDNEVMLDEDSLTRYLDAHKTKELSENYLEKIIREKELEREVLLSQCDDELFLLKTQKQHQKLFHIMIQELGKLIEDDRLREIFLAISSGEPISRVAVRQEMTYAQTLTTYQSILNTLNRNSERIATFCIRGVNSLSGKVNIKNPLTIPLTDFFHFHAYAVLCREADIRTLGDLLKYTAQHGWHSLKNLPGIGNTTYTRMVSALQSAGFIMVRKDKEIEISPELAVLMM